MHISAIMSFGLKAFASWVPGYFCAFHFFQILNKEPLYVSKLVLTFESGSRPAKGFQNLQTHVQQNVSDKKDEKPTPVAAQETFTGRGFNRASTL